MNRWSVPCPMEVNLVGDGFEDFVALAEVVFAALKTSFMVEVGEWAQALAWRSAMPSQTSPWLEW